MKYSVNVSVTRFILPVHIRRCTQAKLISCMRERADLYQGNDGVSFDYAFMSCGGSWQSLSSVKIHGKAAQSCSTVVLEL